MQSHKASQMPAKKRCSPFKMYGSTERLHDVLNTSFVI